MFRYITRAENSADTDSTGITGKVTQYHQRIKKGKINEEVKMRICIDWDKLWDLVENAIWDNIEGTDYVMDYQTMLGVKERLEMYLKPYKEG